MEPVEFKCIACNDHFVDSKMHLFCANCGSNSLQASPVETDDDESIIAPTYDLIALVAGECHL